MPRLRLPRALVAESMAWVQPPGRARTDGFRAIANWDEDAITLAVEAARSCLGGSDGAPEGAKPESLYLCSTSAPFADRDDALMVAAALDLPEDVQTLNLGSSLRAGTGGLISAAQRASAPTLVVASETRLARPGSAQELAYGDGAAACLVGPPSGAALASIVAVRSIGSDFVDHYRMAGRLFDYSLEERWIRDESLMILVPRLIRELLAGAGCEGGAVRHLALPATASVAKRIADSAGLGRGEARRHGARRMRRCRRRPALAPDGRCDSRPRVRAISSSRWASAKASTPCCCAPSAQYGTPRRLLRTRSGSAAKSRATCATCRTAVCWTWISACAPSATIGRAHSVAYRKREALSAFKGGRCEQLRHGAVSRAPGYA